MSNIIAAQSQRISSLSPMMHIKYTIHIMHYYPIDLISCKLVTSRHVSIATLLFSSAGSEAVGSSSTRNSLSTAEARVNRNSFVLIVFKTILLSNEDSLVQVEYSDRLGRVNNFKMQSLKMSLLLLAFMVTKCMTLMIKPIQFGVSLEDKR